ncbi:MAG: hypothetical protein ACD_21C00054G0002 [uncultured bacterium]|nr:MAG: hypothetical protein ACD_21C00054G0002 [uncultured bacterium]
MKKVCYAMKNMCSTIGYGRNMYRYLDLSNKVFSTKPLLFLEKCFKSDTVVWERSHTTSCIVTLRYKCR